MLQLILGTSGTGKTTKVLDLAISVAKEGQKVILVVPEQFSFQTERTVLATLSGSSALGAEVLSFRRLCDNIFRTYGGLAGKTLTDTAKKVIMKLAISEVEDELTIYARQSKKTAFIETILGIVEELKSSGTYPAQLIQVIDEVENKQLKDKLSDISKVYTVYQGIVDRSYIDPLDDIAKAVNILKKESFFEGKKVFIDGFDYFSPPERRMIEIMIAQAEEVVLSMNANGLDLDGTFDIFSIQKNTARKLYDYAAMQFGANPEPIYLTENKRTTKQSLLALERYLAENKKQSFDNVDDEETTITIVSCEDQYEEAAFAAAQITNLVRDLGYRYRDIAVVMRSLGDYEMILQNTFAKYGIPLFFDKKESITTRPLIAFVLTALEASFGQIKTELILRLARNPASGIPFESAAALENYAYIWSIQGEAWLREFKNNPQGNGIEISDYQKEQLEIIENARVSLVRPLLKLRQDLQNTTGNRFALAVFNYLQSTDAVNYLKQFYNQLSEQEAEQELEEAATLYNVLLDVLDLFSEILGDTGFSLQVFIEMFEMAMNSVELGEIPNTNDQTIAGSADKIRLNSPKIVFALGLNEGVFPAKISSGSIFTNSEQEELTARGIELSASPVQRILLERFYLYSCFSAPKEQLYITYSSATLTGAEQEPTLVLDQIIKNISVNKINAAALPPEFYICDIFTLREQYVRAIVKNQHISALRKVLLAINDLQFVNQIDMLLDAEPAKGILSETAAELINSKLSLSPTKIENFFRCPYMFFMQNLLRLQKRKKVEFNPLSSGSAIHYVMEQLINDVGSKQIVTLSDESLIAKIKSYLEHYIESLSIDSKSVSGRFRYQFERLSSLLLILAKRVGAELAQSDFEAVGLEVPVNENGDVKPLTFTLEDGTIINVSGIIDRVDIYQSQNEKYARVVDYKSGGKDFVLEEVFCGLNMQMLIYLFALCDDTTSRFGNLSPAGILYMPGTVRAADIAPDVPIEQVQELIGDTLKMKGLLVEDEKILRAMEQTLEGKYIPAKYTGKGTLHKGSMVRSATAFEEIKETVYKNVIDMGNALVRGEVAPYPAIGRGMNPCDYCDYDILCRNKDGQVFKDLTAKGKEEDDG